MQVAPVIFHKDDTRPHDPQPIRLDGEVYADAALPPALSQRLSVLGVHGAGIVNGHFVGGTQDAILALADVSPEDLPHVGEEMAGSLTLYLWDALERRVTILADPLGGSMVFLHRDREGVAISSHMGGLVALRARQGKPMRKSLAHGLCTLVTGGAGGLEDGSYEGVELLPRFHYIEVDRTGARFRPYRARDEFYSAPLPYDEGLDRVEHDIRRNVRAVAAASHSRKISQLTGGIDSRLVLAALMAEGVASDFAFNCMGSDTSADKITAHGLAHEFGLTMTAFTGLSAYHQPETFNDRVLAAMRYSAGMHITPAHSWMRRSQALVLSGGYSGAYRSTYRRGETPLTERDPLRLAEATWGAIGFSESEAKRMISEDLRERYVRKVSSLQQDMHAAGVPVDAWEDFYKVRQRTRFFVGEISRQWSPFASRFDPLYSTAAARTTLHLPFEVRKAGLFMFDLIDRLAPELSTMPYDTDRFTDIYRQQRTPPELRLLDPTKKPSYNDWRQPRPENLASVQWPQPTAVHKALAKKLRAPIQQVVELDRVRGETRRMVASLPAQERQSVFNEHGLKLLYNRAERHGWSLRCLFVIHSVLLWYTDTETPSPVPGHQGPTGR